MRGLSVASFSSVRSKLACPQRGDGRCLADGLAALVGVLRTSDRGTYLLQAVVGLVVGGVLLFWPGTSAHTLLMVSGAWALFTGASHILAARQVKVEESQRGLMTTMGGVVE